MDKRDASLSLWQNRGRRILFYFFFLFAFLSFDRRNTLVMQGKKKTGNVIKIIANDGV